MHTQAHPHSLALHLQSFKKAVKTVKPSKKSENS